MSGDFSTQDVEMQQNAFLTLQFLPLSEKKEFLKQNEGMLLAALEREPKEETERFLKLFSLQYLPDFLLDLYVQVTGQDSSFTF